MNKNIRRRILSGVVAFMMSVTLIDNNFKFNSNLAYGSSEENNEINYKINDEFKNVNNDLNFEIEEGFVESDKKVIGDIESEKEEQIKKKYQTIKAKMYTDETYSKKKKKSIFGGSKITVTGQLPIKSKVKVFPVELNLEGKEVVTAYDIKIFDSAGDEFEPGKENKVEVTISDEALKNAIKEDKKLSIYHIDNNDKEEEVDIKGLENDVIRFEAESFSVYAIIYDDVRYDAVDLTYNGDDSSGYDDKTLPDQLNGNSFAIVGVRNSTYREFTVDDNKRTASKNVIKENDEYKFDGEPVVWKFEYADKVDVTSEQETYGKYKEKDQEYQFYISTEINNERYYLNINTNNNTLNLTETKEQPLILEVYKDDNNDSRVHIKCRDNDNKSHAFQISGTGNYNAYTEPTKWNNKQHQWFWLFPISKQVIYNYSFKENNEEKFKEPWPTIKTIPQSQTSVTVETLEGLGRDGDRAKHKVRNGSKSYEYTINGFKYGETNYNFGDFINIGTERNIKLTSTWSDPEETDIKITVEYDLNLPTKGYTMRYENKPKVLGLNGEDNEEVENDNVNNYIVRGLTKGTYKRKTSSNETNARDIITYQFMGFELENGNKVSPGDDIDLIENIEGYDVNDDCIVKLKAIWSNLYDEIPGASADENGKGQNSTGRYVVIGLLKEIGEATSNDTGSSSTNINDYARSFCGTIAIPNEEIKTPPLKFDGSNVQKNTLIAFDTIPNGADTEKIGVIKCDKLIRNMTKEGISTWFNSKNGNYNTETEYNIKFYDFPTDEEVLDSYKKYQYPDENAETEFILDGVPQKMKDITTDNYVIRWFGLKFQNDCWHLDGRLTTKENFITIRKTFSGETSAINILKERGDYKITVKNEDDESEKYILKFGEGYDRTDRNQYGYEDGLVDSENNVYGYVDYDEETNTYTWLVKVKSDSGYNIKEENYFVNNNYGVISQYSVTTPGVEGTGVAANIAKQEYKGSVKISPTKCMTDNITLEGVRTLNLTNTYVRTGTFTIVKTDSDTVGSPMTGVKFKIKSKANGEKIKFANNNTTGDTKYYTVASGDENEELEAETDENGNIYFILPVPTEEAENDNVFIITEEVPEGYSAKEGKEPEFEVIVSRGENGGAKYKCRVTKGEESIAKIRFANVEYEDSDIINGAFIKNKTDNYVNITAKKIWWNEDLPDVEKVTVKLTGTAEGEEEITRLVELSNLNNWTHIWSDMPRYLGGKRVTYTVEEIKVGYLNPDNNDFIWSPQYTYKYYEDEEREIEIEVDKAKYMDVTVTNNLKNYVAPKITLKTVDNKNLELEGAKYKLYEIADNGSETIKYNGEDVKVSLLLEINDNNKSEIELIRDKKYILEEIETKFGYDIIRGKIKIEVNKEGNITVSCENQLSAQLINYNEGRLTVINDMMIPPLTGYYFNKPVYIVMFTMSLFMLITIVIIKLFNNRYKNKGGEIKWTENIKYK